MLRQAGMIKEIAGLSSGSLVMPAGRSALVRRIYAPFPTADSYITMYVDRKVVGYYRVQGKSGRHLDMPKPGYLNLNLMETLEDAGINIAIPVGEGQTFSYEYSSGNAHTVIVYDLYDGGDITPVMKNGSESKDYVFVQYMDASTYPSASGDVHLDTALTPSMFPDFPCGAAVPARHTIKVLGFVGSPVGDAADAGNYIVTDYCKIVKDREVLFDEDRRGFPFRNGGLGAAQVEYTDNVSMIHSNSPVPVATGKPTYGKALILDKPLQFMSGEELLVYLTFRLVGARTLTDGAIDFATILDVHVG